LVYYKAAPGTGVADPSPVWRRVLHLTNRRDDTTSPLEVGKPTDKRALIRSVQEDGRVLLDVVRDQGMTGDRRRRNKGMRWMPWRRVPKKDVGSCEKRRGADNKR
jgi:hypothetical protein